jgi:hypothetical protein
MRVFCVEVEVDLEVVVEIVDRRLLGIKAAAPSAADTTAAGNSTHAFPYL